MEQFPNPHHHATLRMVFVRWEASFRHFIDHSQYFCFLLRRISHPFIDLLISTQPVEKQSSCCGEIKKKTPSGIIKKRSLRTWKDITLNVHRIDNSTYVTAISILPVRWIHDTVRTTFPAVASELGPQEPTKGYCKVCSRFYKMHSHLPAR